MILANFIRCLWYSRFDLLSPRNCLDCRCPGRFGRFPSVEGSFCGSGRLFASFGAIKILHILLLIHLLLEAHAFNSSDCDIKALRIQDKSTTICFLWKLSQMVEIAAQNCRGLLRKTNFAFYRVVRRPRSFRSPLYRLHSIVAPAASVFFNIHLRRKTQNLDVLSSCTWWSSLESPSSWIPQLNIDPFPVSQERS